MALNKGLRSAVYSVIALSAVILITLCLCTPAFALDSALTENEHGDWDNADDVLIYSERDFSGTLKRITDSKNGCFYIFIQLYDNRIKSTNPDNLVISFRLKNDAGSYCFSANRNGFVNTNATVMESVRLEANFKRISETGRFCSILIGFELLNKTDRAAANFIDCTYTCGNSRAYTLFESAVLDMTANTSASSAKASSRKKDGSAASSASSSGKRAADQKSTKYTPTGQYSSAVAADNTKAEYEESARQQTQPGTLESSIKSGASDYTSAGKTTLSKPSIIALCAAGAASLTGAVLIAAGIAGTRRGKKEETNENSAESERTDSSNTAE